jgi:biopolymer transport protein ExbB
MSIDLGVFHEGGFFMYCLLGVSFLSLVIVLERFILLKFQYPIRGRVFFAEIKKDLLQGEHQQALKYANQFRGVPLAEVIAAGLSTMGRTSAETDTAMETETLRFIPQIMRRLNYLPSLANIATLFGLLGTITGLIMAFKNVGGAEAAGLTREQGLAGGIAVAMYNTAFGLIVAIPTSLAYLYLANAANRMVDDIDYYASALKRLFQDLPSTKVAAPLVKPFTQKQKAVGNFQDQNTRISAMGGSGFADDYDDEATSFDDGERN